MSILLVLSFLIQWAYTLTVYYLCNGVGPLHAILHRVFGWLWKLVALSVLKLHTGYVYGFWSVRTQRFWWQLLSFWADVFQALWSQGMNAFVIILTYGTRYHSTKTHWLATNLIFAVVLLHTDCVNLTRLAYFFFFYHRTIERIWLVQENKNQPHLQWKLFSVKFKKLPLTHA